MKLSQTYYVLNLQKDFHSLNKFGYLGTELILTIQFFLKSNFNFPVHIVDFCKVQQYQNL